MMFYTGASRAAATILGEQDQAVRKNEDVAIQSLHRIKAAAVEMRALLERGKLDAFGELLDAGWQEKKKLARAITNPQIDQAYERARAAGAAGGKIAGAGGGGFLMLYCEEQCQGAVTEALAELGLTRMDFRFDDGGATVLMNALPRLRSLDRSRLEFLLEDPGARHG
jgi:D-glycero-alpha-D-manno-heptose-7-phosphate kinase